VKKLLSLDCNTLYSNASAPPLVLCLSYWYNQYHTFFYCQLYNM